MGESKKRQLGQYILENGLIAMIMTTMAYLVNTTLVFKVIEFMFAQSIKTQNNLRRIETGEIGAFDEIYELSRYNVVSIDLKDYLLVLFIIMAIICLSCLISFMIRKKENFREFLNS